MKTRVESPRRYTTGDGRTIYALCLEVFPGFFGNVYLLDDGSRRVLVDCGSGFEQSNQNLLAALASLETEYGRRVELRELDAILVTHGHMDHFGGLQFVREHSDAPVGIHILDRPVLANYEERLLVASRQLRVFLGHCGLSVASREGLMRMYTAPKSRYRSIEVGFLLAEGTAVELPEPGGAGDLEVEVFHVPGHCPGQVCLRVDDVMLTADHVLSRITPHQAPESITLNTGLGHYLEALEKIERVDGVRIGLGGHEEPTQDVAARCAEIRRLHRERLDRILDLCREPQTTSEISRQLFGGVRGYDVLLALEEAGAHVEYLHQRGELEASNLSELESEDEAVIRYRARF